MDMRRCLVLLALLVPSAALAQRILGEFTGTITDPSQATITGAQVTAVETATQRKWSTESNATGLYRLVSLPAGTEYEITVEARGFRAARREKLTLDVGEVRRLDITLEVGSVADSVTVTDSATALNLEKGQISAVVNQRTIIDLPLNGRNVYQLAELQPGVVRVAGSGLQESETTDARIGAAGTRFRDNQILLDGVTNNNDRQGGRTTLSLSPDAVEQFLIVTNNLSAEYGRSGGAMISVITRGGTNDLHGSLFWFLRNDNLDASNTFEARSGSQPEFKRNQFGATLGGPVLKNRLFYFFSYQGLRLRQPGTRQVTVETPQFRDFVARTRPNSIAARLFRDFPAPNPTFNIRDIGSPATGVRVAGPADGVPDLGETFVAIPGFTNDDQLSVRLDHTFNSGKDTVSFRFSQNDDNRESPSGNSARAFTQTTKELDQNLALNHTHVFSPNLINDLRLGFNHDPQYTDGNFPEIPFIQMQTAGRAAERFASTDGFVFPLDIRTNTFSVYDAASLIRARHSLKIGGEFRAFQENSDFPTFLKPQFLFEDIFDFADDEPLSVQARVRPQTGLPAGTYRNFRQKEFAFFLQDDWKVTPRLTLNLGLRYDNFATLTDKNGLISTLYFTQPNLGNAAVRQASELYNRDNLNFAPRFGFAWDPTGAANWSIRGGGGVFYSRVWSNFTGNSRFNTPFSLAVTLSALANQNPRAVYRIPFTGDESFARPLDSFNGSTALRPALQTIDPTLQTPYAPQWFLGVQRRLPGDWIAELNYNGNAGRKLLLRNEINRFSGDRADNVVNRVHPSFGSITHGFNGASSSYHGANAQLSRRFQSGYSAQIAYTFGRSIDNDSEPFGGGAGELQGSQEVNNIALDRGPSAFDVTHRLAANFVWELPFLRSRADAMGSILGGWQLNGIVSMQSGFPFTVVTAEDYNLDGVFSDRPNPTRALGRKPGSSPRNFSDGVFGSVTSFSPLFAPAGAGNISQLGRNTFRGPGFATVDGSLMKIFRTPWFTRDNGAIEFRAEFFNLLNRVNLRAPGNSLGTYNTATGQWSNVNFGRSTLAFEGRQIQFALKFRF